MEQRPPRLMDKVRETLRLKHYSSKTEETYVHWTRSVRFVRFHKLRHPREMGDAEVQAFLAHLAVRQKVSASTQNQALSALLFLYREVLQIDLTVQFETVGAKRSKTVPTVLTKTEVNVVLSKMTGMCGLMAKLLYGSGLRLNECVQLRVKDIDFGQHQIIVHDGKGEQDRVTMLPEQLMAPCKSIYDGESICTMRI